MSAKNSHEATNETKDGAGAGVPSRSFATPFLRLGRWAVGNRINKLIAATVALSLIGATVATWFYLAQLALESQQPSIGGTLDLLEMGHIDEARAQANRLLDSGTLKRNELGGPLFVLGGVKVSEAESQSTPVKRRTDYLIASRYLKEARFFGFPPGHESEGLLLFGRSLIESDQFHEGIAVLEELLALQPAASKVPQVHRIVAETCLFMPKPELEKAARHFGAILAGPPIEPAERAEVIMLQAITGARLGNFDDARDALAGLEDTARTDPEAQLTAAEITLEEFAAAKASHREDDDPAHLDTFRPAVNKALSSLEQIHSNAQATELKRRAAYLRAYGLELLGQSEESLAQFSRVRQLYSDSPEALAATLHEASSMRERHEDKDAVIGYKRVLEALATPGTHRSYVVSLPQIQELLLTAIDDFVARAKFDEAIALVGAASPLFSRSEQLSLQARTLEKWGDALLLQANDESPRAERLKKDGLRRLREAGMTYEQLANSRFATPAYTTDLWKSANAFYRGHNFTNAVRLLNVYLDNELELRNAEALLLIGQAYLALGKPRESIVAFEECIEFHPHDPVTYQARIDCAKAYWNEGEFEAAERLLRANISGTTLKPTSQEWRDSLFILGTLLHEEKEYADAIDVLQEAIQRYPDDSQRLLAQYVIGESYRRWAAELLGVQQRARSDNERSKSLQLARERLAAALKSFKDVQRSITLRAHDIHEDPLIGTMLRNCYMFEAAVLFDLDRYDEAIKAYSNVSALYPNEPFVLETFVQIANCWHRLNRADKARGAIQQAQIALERLPGDADFASATSFSREEWRLLLNDMSRW